MRQTDYLIVGQGIAGSVLALALMERGKSVTVIDSPGLSSSSKVAAGAFNPFNFRKMVNNWRAEELIPAANAFYRKHETASATLLRPRKVMKIFTTADERRLWEKACAEKTGLFADPQIAENPFPEIVDAPFGIGMVNDAGHVDTGMLMHLVRERLKETAGLYGEIFDPSLLRLTEGGIVYAEKITASKLVFCEGHLSRQNLYFSFLPVRPVKGQVLHVHIPGLRLTNIINRGVYLLPQGEELFTAGATFENDKDDELTTVQAEEELLGKLQKFIRVPVRVESRYAGVRPAVKDRRPLLGRHPEHPQLCVFNGFGSKGVLLAPWLAEKLIAYLESGIPLPDEVQIERFIR